MVKKERWALINIYSSYNNTHIILTDITGAEILAKISGGHVVKASRLEGTPAAAVMMAKRIIEEAKAKGITGVHIKIKAPGGHNGPWIPGPGARAALKIIATSDLKIGFIEDVTPIPHDRCRRKGGRRGRRM